MCLVLICYRRKVGAEQGIAYPVFFIVSDCGAFKAFVDFGYKFFRVERFGDIVVAFKRESVEPVHLVCAVGQEEYYHLFVVLPDNSRRLKSVEFGHVYVQKNQVGTRLAVHFQAHLAIVGIYHLIAFRLDEPLEEHRVA